MLRGIENHLNAGPDLGVIWRKLIATFCRTSAVAKFPTWVLKAFTTEQLLLSLEAEFGKKNMSRWVTKSAKNNVAKFTTYLGLSNPYLLALWFGAEPKRSPSARVFADLLNVMTSPETTMSWDEVYATTIDNWAERQELDLKRPHGRVRAVFARKPFPQSDYRFQMRLVPKDIEWIVAEKKSSDAAKQHDKMTNTDINAEIEAGRTGEAVEADAELSFASLYEAAGADGEAESGPLGQFDDIDDENLGLGVTDDPVVAALSPAGSEMRSKQEPTDVQAAVSVPEDVYDEEAPFYAASVSSRADTPEGPEQEPPSVEAAGLVSVDIQEPKHEPRSIEATAQASVDTKGKRQQMTRSAGTPSPSGTPAKRARTFLNLNRHDCLRLPKPNMPVTLQWLNATVINDVLGELLNGIGDESMIAVDSALVADPGAMSRQPKVMDRIQADGSSRIFLPVNVENHHWILVIVDKGAKGVQVYDGMADPAGSTATILKRTVDGFLRAAMDLTCLDDWSWDKPFVPQQNDEINCGVIILISAALLCGGSAFPATFDATVWRLCFAVFLTNLLTIDGGEGLLEDIRNHWVGKDLLESITVKRKTGLTTLPASHDLAGHLERKYAEERRVMEEIKLAEEAMSKLEKRREELARHIVPAVACWNRILQCSHRQVELSNSKIQELTLGLNARLMLPVHFSKEAKEADDAVSKLIHDKLASIEEKVQSLEHFQSAVVAVIEQLQEYRQPPRPPRSQPGGLTEAAASSSSAVIFTTRRA